MPIKQKVSTFRMNEDLIINVKVYAARSQTSITEILDKALREYMKNHPLKKAEKEKEEEPEKVPA